MISSLAHAGPAPVVSQRTALFLDFDGTLAPLQDDASSVALPAGAEEVLTALFAKLGGAVCVISGRDIRDLSARIPAGLWRAGGHGLEVCRPGQAPAADRPEAPAGLHTAARDLASGFAGAFVEDKGPICALHYRAAPDAGLALDEGARRIALGFSGYVVQHGKMVIELKPKRANKGAALRALMNQDPFSGRTAVMVGDDVTDEDAFHAAQDLGGLAVKVGEGETAADIRLASPDDVHDWLKSGVTSDERS